MVEISNGKTSALARHRVCHGVPGTYGDQAYRQAQLGCRPERSTIPGEFA
jgi:hypothetical protein